ncbi:MAG: helix-turn-helix transcriptional regulator [Prevotella sp.]|nr:helix-turn-helix transcriptional regulator [Prevotella sp.]
MNDSIRKKIHFQPQKAPVLQENTYLCTIKTFFRYNIVINYMNISAFLIGITTSFFTIFAIHILCWRKRRTRFQTVVGIIMAVWAVWCAKDLITTFPHMYSEEVLRWILIIDGWSAITYSIFMIEVVMPGWTTWRRLALLSLPFAFFTLLYAVWPRREVIYAYVAFLWCFAWAIIFVGYIKMKRYLSYVRREYSNIDKIDVSWLRPVFLFAIVGQLAWLFTSLYASVATDIVYFFSIIVLWLVVLHYSWDFQPIVVENETEQAESMGDMKTMEESLANTTGAPSEKPISPIAHGKLEQLVEEQKLYLRPNLTLQELAQALGSNRTYVSTYLSQVMGQTFYDYINQLRIERSAIPLITEHPEYKFEYIAHLSGFTSMSTFRRAFIKKTGQTPSQFAAVKA